MPLKKILLLLFPIIIALILVAQDKNFFIVNGRLTADGNKTEGASIAVSKDGETEEITYPAKNGRFDFEFEFNHEYRLTFNLDGYFQKIVIVSTYVPDEVLQDNNRFPPLPFVLNLFKEIGDIDKTFTIKPVARVFYNARIDNFDAEIYFSDDELRQQIEDAKLRDKSLADERKNISKADELEHANLEKNYDKTIAEADAHYQKKEFQPAIEKFQQATLLFPDRPYPKDRIAEINDLIAAMQLAENTEDSYQQAIHEGDQLFSENRFEEAISAYQRALDVRSNDKYARGRIDESKQMLAKQQNDLQYNNLLAQADNAFMSRNFEQARSLYQKAIQQRPNNSQYPKEQLKRIDIELTQLAQKAAIEKQYNNAMMRGNETFQQQAYQDALTAFNQAINIKPGDEQAQIKINETQNKIQQQENEKRYAELINKADQQFASKAWQPARELYSQALTIKPTETYPSAQIDKIDQQLNTNQQIENLLTEANTAFADQQYTQAKSLYQQVLQLQTDHAISKNRITEIDRLLQQQDIDQQYASAINLADQAFEQKQFKQAQTGYQQASSLKPNESYPKQQLARIEAEQTRLRELAEATEKAYSEAMLLGSNQLGKESFDAARRAFTEAKSIKPDERLPGEMIARVDSLQRVKQQALADAIARQQQQAELDQKYTAALTEGDRLFMAEDWLSAKTAYQSASNLKPAESYPTNQIKTIDSKLATQARQTEAYNTTIAAADQLMTEKNYTGAASKYEEALLFFPDESYPKMQILRINEIIAQIETAKHLDKAYQEKLTEGDKLLAQNTYLPAKAAYSSASQLKPNEQYPKDKIMEIDSILAENLRQQQAAAQQQQAYAEWIKKADLSFSQQEYENAKTAYQEALTIMTADEYATQQIRLIDEKLQQLAREEATRQQLENNYQAKLEEGRQAFEKELFPAAKAAYRQALTIKPDEKFPVQQIATIDSIMAAHQQQQQIDAEYKQLITEAQTAWDGNQLEKSLDLYRQASLVKPNETLPPQRIAEIEKQIADRNEAERLAKEAELERLAQEKANREKYQSLITQADSEFNKQSFESAKNHYSEALQVFPDEQYPKNKITEIEQLLIQLAQAKLEQQQKARTDSLAKAQLDAFSKKITQAEDLTEKQLFRQAIDTYVDAIAILPSKTDEVNKKIAGVQSLMAAIQKTEENYRQAISQGDQKFANEEWATAKTSYQKALGYKPEEEYPSKQIEQIDKKLIALQEEARQKRANSMITENYQEIIRQADKYYEKKDYTVAQFYYYQAADIQPENPYPKERIAEISQLIDQSLHANQLKAYNDAIVKADGEFKNENYSIARFYYNQALSIKSWEQYPKKQIKEIGRLTNSLLSQQDEEEYQKLISAADEAFFDKNLAVARSYFQRAQTIKKDDQYPTIKLQEIQQIIDQQKKDQKLQEYQQLIQEADQAFSEKNYSVARFYYNKAKTLMPEEKYPEEQLKKIREMLQ